jgi:2-polyprenyl-6-hydroxyphenyl methylase/3-demethylubiquinone-9 3-methyltransferase
MPRGTHDYARFIKPAELARLCRNAGLDVLEIVGIRYNPFDRSSSICADTDVNYILRARRQD